MRKVVVGSYRGSPVFQRRLDQGFRLMYVHGLGANLARREIIVMYREPFTRLPELRAAGRQERLYSNFINGIKHLPCGF